MKILIWILWIFVFGVLIFIEGGGFIILPQSIGLKQLLFLVVVIIGFFTSIYYLGIGNPERALGAFFIFYPFYAQSTNYFNICTSLFIISPTLIVISVLYLISPRVKSSASLRVFIIFNLSILISVINSTNISVSTSFYILAVGVFIITALLSYNIIASSSDTINTAKILIYSIFLGMAIFLVIETVIYQFKPLDIVNILLRKWNLLSSRYYTAGYKEPNGFGFVVAYFLPFLIYFFEIRKITKSKVTWLLSVWLIFGVFLLFLSGSRGALISFINVMIFLFFFGKRMLNNKQYRINVSRYAILLSPLLIMIFSILVYRTFLKPEDLSSYKTENFEIAGQDIEAIGTTIGYIHHTEVSWNNLVNLPLGTGPLSLAPLGEDYIGGEYSSFSLVTNFISLGAMFGWISLAIWILFIVLITRKTSKLCALAKDLKSSGLALVSLGAIWASFFPASFFIGPQLNWSTFDYYAQINRNIGVPSEYPSLISGLIIGILLGLLRRSSSSEIKTNI
jgi:hypothetical protein